ncbi:MAG: tetracycline resistance MFS efflux pump [Candidatus Promineifilaceae bacterium]
MDDKNTAVSTEEKLDFKRILPIFIIVIIDLMGLTIFIPLLPLYATSFGASPAMVGMLGATYPLMQFIGAPLLGRLSDRYGRKPILMISQTGTFIGFIVMGFAHTLPLLFLARLIDGISGANIATAQAAISDVTTEKTRTQGLGLIGAAFGLGFIVGPLIAFGALAVSNNNYRIPAFVAAVFSLASILLTQFLFTETLPPDKRQVKTNREAFSFRAMLAALSHPAVGILLILMFAQQLAFGGLEQMLSLFTLSRLGLNASGNAVLFVFIGIIVVAVQGKFIGPWSRRFGDRALVFGGLVMLAAGMLLSTAAPRQAVPWYDKAELVNELSGNDGTAVTETAVQEIPLTLPDDTNKGWLGLAWVMFAMIPASIAGGLLQPAINSLITKRVEPSEIGGMLGISSAFLSAANALAPLIGGALFEKWGDGAPFAAGGLLLIILWAIAIRRLQPGREKESAPGLARGGGGH